MSLLRVIFSWFFLATGSLSAVPGPVSAGSAYRWTDALGQTHFSDSPPPPGAVNQHEFDLPAPAPARVQGLRSGERRGLRDYEARRERLRRAASRRTAAARGQLEQQRQACRQAREGRDHARSRAELRQQSTFLRRQCW